MKPYASIETVYTRDADSKLLNFGEIRCPETSCVKTWTISEKIDGTNIRAIVTLDGIAVKGRTDKAQIPPGLEGAVRAALPSHDKLVAYFTEYRGKELLADWSVTFYGEGYGAGIQKGGDYSDVKRFRVFDLLLGETYWLDDNDMRKICDALNIPTAPLLDGRFYGDLPTTKYDMDELFWIGRPERIGWGSHVAKFDRNEFGVQPEGIVAKPTRVLFDKYGSRVMWKLTYREFRA